MSIYKSNENVNGVYVGSQRYIQIRLGSDLYWEAEKSYSNISLEASYSTTAVAASGGSLSPTISNLSQSWGWYSDTSGGGLISSIPVSYSFTGTVPSGWSINSSTGAVTIPSRGTTTGNALSATVRVTASANGKSTYKDCTVSQAANSITNSNYNPSYSNYTVTAGTITDNIIASGGSASWTEGTCTRTRTYYYLYSSGSTTQHSTVESGTTTSSATGSSTRFTINNTNRTASHSSMYGDNVTDTLTVTWYNCWDSSVSTSGTASVYNGYTSSTEYYDYTVVAGTITNNLTAAGGGISWTAGSAYHYSRNKYTNDSGYIEYSSGTKVTDSVTSSASGNSRFSINNSNRTATHSSMGTNSTTDTITVTWKNASDTSVSTTDYVSVTNQMESVGALSVTSSHSTLTSGPAATANYITIATASQTVTYTSGSTENYTGFTFTLDSSSPSWVSLYESSTSSRSLSVDENLSTSTRTGTASVTVTGYSGASKTVTCAITQYGYEISVSPTSVSSISVSGGTTSLSVYSYEQGWTASSPSWITLSPTSGSEGTTNVTATVAANTGSARTGFVRFTGSRTGEATCSITQPTGATASLSASATTILFDSTSSSTSVTIKATNQSWTASKSATWITLGSTSGSSGSSTLTISATTNTSSGIRSGTVTITGSVSGTVTISVKQNASAGGYISLTFSSLFLSSDSLSSAANYATLSDGAKLSSSNTVTYLATVNEWLTIRIGYNDGRAIFNCIANSANTTGSSRSVAVTVTKSGYTSASFTVTQSG